MNFNVSFVLTAVLITYVSACLQNYEYKFVSEWNENGAWKTNAHIKPNFKYKLINWELHMEFYDPLAVDMTTWITEGIEGTKGKTKVVLKPKPWNKVLNPYSFDMSYFVNFKNKQGQNRHFKCIEFCGTKIWNGEYICGLNPSTTKSPSTSFMTSKTTTATTSPPTTITSPATTSTRKPPINTTTRRTITTTASVTTTNPGACKPKYDYKEVLEKSLLFYEAQRSGKLPSDQRVKWRHDSTMKDGNERGLDLTGGYFDAGDYVKFGFPMASTITNLAWGMIEFANGYKAANQFEHGLKAIKWGTDYFIKCHLSPTKYVGQVGKGDIDHFYWGRPEDMKVQRPVYDIDENRPGSELVGETAAALAAASIVFKQQDVEYASTLIQHAKELYSFSMDHRGNYHDAIPDVVQYYRSFSGYTDELAWASLWLYLSTGEQIYKDNFLKEFNNQALSQNPGEFSWDNKWYGVQVLAQKLKVTNQEYLSNFNNYLKQPKKTPKGLFYVQKWGSTRHAANLAFLANVASTISSDSKFYRDFARGQLHYMLGDSGRSFVVGFGKNPPQRPHHRSSSCPVIGPCNWDNYNSPKPNPQILYGALVGGPNERDGYLDNRSDFIKNEVTCDYNAGFQSAIAGLIDFSVDGQC